MDPPAAPSPYDSPTVATMALTSPARGVEASGTTTSTSTSSSSSSSSSYSSASYSSASASASSSSRQESTVSISSVASAPADAYSFAAVGGGSRGDGANAGTGNYAAVPLGNPRPARTVSAPVRGGAAAGDSAPKHVSALCTGLQQSKSHDAHICETCGEFWAVNFVDCPRAIVGTSATASSLSRPDSKGAVADRAQNAPETPVVIRALVREYQRRGLLLPEPVQGRVQFVDALSCALDPSSCGRVYPEYYFALCATFGPFDVMIAKLTSTVFFSPPEAEEATRQQRQDRHGQVLQPIKWFHGYASRRDVKKDMARDAREKGSGGGSGGEGGGGGVQSERLPSSSSRPPKIGAYILRFSTNRPGHLTLSWVKPSANKKAGKGEFIHTLIQNAGGGFRCTVKETGRSNNKAPADVPGSAVVESGEKKKVSRTAGGVLFPTVGDLLRYHSSRFRHCCQVKAQRTYLRFPEIEEDWLLQRSVSGGHQRGTHSDPGNYAAAEAGFSAYAAAEGAV